MTLLGARYLYLGTERTRPVREWRLLHALAADGFPVPRPLAARIVRAGPWYGGELWTRAVEGRPLPEAVEEGAGAPEAARVLGAVLRRLHAAGVDHPDLHVGNVLVRGGGRRAGDYTVLDFDRGRRRRPGRWCGRRLARLARSLDRLPLAPAERAAWWRALLAGYRAAEITDDGGA
jgi:3-deoxy-D-manno-octulosonic acid kinase